ncbi:MAG: hypothetical protein K2K64_04095 [Muribaculaceae bacterium]|nr:hypothetical protein [Muribaculaceae bacterium]
MTRLLRFPLFKGCAAVLVIFLAFLLHSCAETPSWDSGRVDYLRFSLTADGMGHGIGSGVRGGGLSEMIEEIRVVCFNRAGDNIGVYEPEDVIYSEGCYSVAVENKESIESFALLVNWSGYDVDLSSLDDLDALRNHTVSYRGDSDMIPMYGEGNCDGSGDEINEVELVRSLAKIEVWDKLAGKTIESVVLKDRVDELKIGGGMSAAYSGKEIPFRKDEDSDMWYAYVPPTELGDEDSSARRIELKVNGDTDSYMLWLKDYKGTESGQTEWYGLQANHRYVFNVEGLESPTPPVTEPTGTIRIKWYTTLYGKFEEYDYGAKAYRNSLHLLVKCGNGEVKECIVRGADLETWKTYSLRECYADISLEREGLRFKDIRYILIDSNRPGNNDYIGKWDDNLASSLAEDCSYYPVEEDGDCTVVYLNALPLLFINKPCNGEVIGKFPNDRPYRIYWRNSDIDIISTVNIWPDRGPMVAIKDIDHIKNNGFGYNYIEYTIGNNTNINKQEPVFMSKDKVEIDVLDWVGTAGIYTYDFFPQTIDGKDYYVFYVD